jgi:hypothetical protein
MAKRLQRPKKRTHVRLEWEEANMRALDMAAAECGLSIASFARLALELLTAKGQVTLNDVKAEVDRLTREPEAEKPAQETGKRQTKESDPG